MSWPRKKLKEVAELSLGKMLDEKKNKGEMLPYLANVNVRWGRFDLEGLRTMRFQEKELGRFSIKRGDIIMCEGGEPGRCAIWSGQTPTMMYQKALHRIRPHDNVDSKFIYYWFLYLGRTNGFAPFFTGATIKHLPKEKLEEIEVVFPPLPTQKRIASILSAYDDLIENNLKRIKLLEELAQRTYEEWFVKFRVNGKQLEVGENGLPIDWSIKNLSAFFDVRTGKKNANYGTTDGHYPFFTCSQEPIKAPTYAFDASAILLAGNGEFNVKVFRGKFEAYQRTYVLIPTDEKNLIIIYRSLKHNLKQLTGGSKGSVIKYLTKDMIETFQIVYPTFSVLKEFNELAFPLMKQIENLEYQNRLLKESRDILLPRLMSGEIDVEREVLGMVAEDTTTYNNLI